MKKRICSIFAIMIFLASAVFAERPLVKDLHAVTGSGTKVRLTWTLPENADPQIKSLYIYRTTKQISSFSQLKDIEPIKEVSAETVSYIDNLSDFNDYFYTVVSYTKDGIYDLVLLSFNSTVTGVHLVAKSKTEESNGQQEYETLYPEGSLRKTPLPYIDIIEGVNAEPLVSDKAAKATNSLTEKSKKTKAKKLSPYIFEEDLVSPDGGDAYLLFEILRTSFVKKNYKETIEKLNKLTGTNISEETRNRAYFYLGESQYLSNNYEEAVKNFVKVQHVYPTLAKKWLEASLDRL